MLAVSYRHPERGALMILALIFGSVFLILLTSFLSSVVSQSQVVSLRYEQLRATEIAEAGLNQYKWHLAHFAGDTSPDGVVTPFLGPDGTAIGAYELTVTSNSYCGAVTNIDVRSRGWTYANPGAQAVISATYKRPTVAEYSFINNAGVWYGDSRVITGPVHGNQWVRMDGVHNSFVASGIASHGGNDGVFTTTALSTPSLFRFPITAIDFAGMTLDLVGMKASAQADGVFYGPTSAYGYWARFQSDGTVDIYRVTNTRDYWSYSSAEGWHTGERNDITGTTFLATHTIDPDCPMLYFEDKLWIDGAINQKVTVAAADLASGSPTNVVVADNVTYVPNTSAGLLVLAKNDVDIGIDVPNNMTVNGIYIARDGRFGRNRYCRSCGTWWTHYGLPWQLDQYVSRDSLTRLGSVVSNQRGGTEWSSGGVHTSGFRSRITSFDRNQVDDPPPLTPETNDVYELQDWRLEN